VVVLYHIGFLVHVQAKAVAVTVRQARRGIDRAETGGLDDAARRGIHRLAGRAGLRRSKGGELGGFSSSYICRMRAFGSPNTWLRVMSDL
jgi:hypothetical protein